MKLKQDLKVKGTMVVDVVRAIKADKSRKWEQILSAAARETVAQEILLSAWYPYELFMECLKYVFEVYGNNNPEIAKAWGKENGKRVFEGIYSTMVAPRDPEASLEKLQTIGIRTFFNGEVWRQPVVIEPNHLEMKLFMPDPDFRIIVYFILGWIEVIAAMAGAVNPQAVLLQTQSAKDAQTVIKLTWDGLSG